MAAFARVGASSTETRAENGKILVAYGTETGNSQNIASRLSFVLDQKGLPFELKNLSQLRPRHFSKYKYVLIVCSTHGDGDPPEPMAGFYTSIMEADAPSLAGVQYAVLALGDSSYPKFCATGQALDDRFAALGANRILFRQDCDTDYEEIATQWINDVSGLVAAKIPKTQNKNSIHVITETQGVEFNRNNPLRVEVLENIRLSHLSRLDGIHHLELDIDDQLNDLVPGDAIGVLVENPSSQARLLIELAGCREDAIVRVNHRNIPLIEALIEECDITVPTKRLVIAWSKHAKSQFLNDLMVKEADALKEFLRSHQVIDIVSRFPASIDAQSLIDALKPLQPRLYDLANSITYVPGELHILVKCYQYEFQGKTCSGVGSEYLSGLTNGDVVRIFPYKNSKFHFPSAPDIPVIFIAEGTGIGPFRAYLQDSAEKCPALSWLIFTERNFEEDFLYQSEWQAAIQASRISRIDTIFQDQSEGAHSVSSALIENQKMLFDWLAQGAHIYLCGDKNLLTQAEETLQRLLIDDEISWSTLQKTSRVHRNLY